jgi:hypothetical protein
MDSAKAERLHGHIIAVGTSGNFSRGKYWLTSLCPLSLRKRWEPMSFTTFVDLPRIVDPTRMQVSIWGGVVEGCGPRGQAKEA